MRGVVGADEPDRAVQSQAVAAGNEDKTVTGGGGPRRNGAVLEPHDQLQLHLDGATSTLDDAVDRRVAVVRRHEVAHRHRSRRRLEDRLENQGFRFVAARDLGHLVLRGDQPPSVARVAEQRREDGTGVDSWRTPPVDGPGAIDEGDGLRVTDHAVVLDL
jgi:hypothetical protein